jgi:anaerobic magnesium-protoporphyrin IX monomethyl ester cyclase
MAKLLFVQNLWHEYPGLMALSGVLKDQGHECDLVVARSAKAVVKEFLKTSPDVVGFSVMLGTDEWSREASAAIKKISDVPIVWGGFFPTLYPEVLDYDEVDVICRGEGEGALTDLMNAVDAGEDFSSIANLWVKRDGAVVKNAMRPLIDLDELPFFDRELYAKYPFFNLMPTVVAIDRYCPNSCTFCCQPMLRKAYLEDGLAFHTTETRHYQKISVERAIRELEEIKASDYYRKRKNKLIYFGSDNTNGDRAWFMEFFAEYRDRVGLPFFCSLCLKDFDEDQARLLREANNYIMGCGIECGNSGLRNKVLNKGLPTEDILRAGQLTKKYDIFMFSGNMVGVPGETVEQAFETVDLHRQLGSRGVVVFLCHPYRDSALEKYSIRHGFMAPRTGDEQTTTFHDGSPLALQENIHELENLHKLFLVVMRYPRLDPLWKKLLKVPANPAFDMVFLATHGYLYMKKLQNLGFLDSIRFAAHHVDNSAVFLARSVVGETSALRGAAKKIGRLLGRTDS